MKKQIRNVFLLLLTYPSIAFAYSDYIIASGSNIGISLNYKGVMVVGFYDVNNRKNNTILKNGDIIIKINDKDINSIDDMTSFFDQNKVYENIKITYLRNNKENIAYLDLIKDNDNKYKSGLYVKDKITGVGTLTYIDPKTKLFGALGHEILPRDKRQKLDIRNGNIYDSKVTGIIKSSIGLPGEKNARYNSSVVYGDIFENTKNGVFGRYKRNIDDKSVYKVAKLNEVKEGKAQILTVLNDKKVEKFDINIIKINNNEDSNKNFLIEITDNRLLSKTGGIVQGMSGSPIIQDDKIVGAVTHVIVNEPTKGYGISIIKMLEEAEN